MAILGDAETMSYYPRPFTREEVQAWIERALESYATRGFGLWAMVLKETEEVIGQCGLVPRLIEDVTEVEVGWHVNRGHWRKGYATEAALASRDAGFKHFGLLRLVSLILPANVPSEGVAKKIGMIRERNVDYKGQEHMLYVVRSRPHDDVGD